MTTKDKRNRKKPGREKAPAGGQSGKEKGKGAPSRPKERPGTMATRDLPEGIAFLLLLVLLFIPPFLKGLFFEREFIPYAVATATVFLYSLGVALRRRRLVIVRDPLDAAVLLYSIAYTLAFPAAADLHTALVGAVKGMTLFGLYWMVWSLITTAARRSLLIFTLLAAGAGTALVTMGTALGWLHYPGAFENGAFATTWQYRNTGGIHMAAVFVMAVAMAAGASGPLAAGILAGTAALAAAILFGTTSKGAVVVLVLGLLLFLILAPGEKKVKGAALAAAALGAGALALRWFTAYLQDPLRAAGAVALTAVLAAICGALIWMAARAAEKLPARLRKASLVVVACLVLAALVAAGATWRIWLPEGIAERLPQLLDPKNSSYVARLDLMRWALYILKDYPVVGAGAGAWNALYHRYQDYLLWSTETHSHLLQVGVETGSIGLLGYVGLWVMFAWQAWKRRKDEKYFPETAALCLGAVMLFVHSCFDFDFSLAGMQIMALAMVGAAAASWGKDKPLVEGKAHTATAGMVAFLALTALVVAVCMLIGMNYYQEANTAWTNKEYQRALTLGTKAIKADPWSAYYRVGIGRYYISFRGEPNMVVTGVGLTMQGVRLAPNDLKVLRDAMTNYYYAGALPEAEMVAERIVSHSPLNAASYEVLAGVRAKLAAQKALEGDAKGAKAAAKRVLAVRTLVEDAKKKVYSTRLPYWHGDPLEPTAALKLAEAEACFLLGDLSGATSHLDEVPPDTPGRKGFEAALLRAEGKTTEADAVIKASGGSNSEDGKAAGFWYQAWIRIGNK